MLLPKTAVLLHNLFGRFPYDMYSYNNGCIFKLLLHHLAKGSEPLQDELCGIILELAC